MVEPTQATTHMTTPGLASHPKLVKIRALAPIRVKRNGIDEILSPGDVSEVSEDEAKEFADRVFVGNYGVSGEHGENFAEANRYKVKRAERL
jgi:hypothetical protein